MKSLITVGLFVFGVCFMNSVYCEDSEDAPEPPKEKKTKKPKKPAPILVEMTVIGKITVTEKKNKKDPTKVTKKFSLKDDAGNKINLAAPKTPKKKKKPKKGEVPAPVPIEINLEDYLESKVCITCKGYKKEKKGKEVPVIKQIIKIEKIAD